MILSAVSSDQWTAVLSPREREVVFLVAQGFADKKIAIEPKLSPGTVKQHLHHIFMKLDIRKRKKPIEADPQSMSFNTEPSGRSLKDDSVST
jgi:ATP/maltotriose-dependent transcriptional regulator MalT